MQGSMPGTTLAIRARRHANQFGKPRAERAKRRRTDGETNLRHGEIGGAQQAHRPLNAPRHQVRVRALAKRQLEPTTEMPGRHQRAPRQLLNVERLRKLPIDAIASTTQQHQSSEVTAHVGHRPTRAATVASGTPQRVTSGTTGTEPTHPRDDRIYAMASMMGRNFTRVSSISFSGSLPATMPAPACAVTAM